MNCPSCGVDIDVYLQEKAECQDREKARARKEEEFEQAYGHILRPIRKRRIWVGRIMGIILTAIVFAAWEWFLLSLVPGGVIRFWEGLKTATWFVVLLVLLASLCVAAAGGLIGDLVTSRSRGKQEKELRKNFGL